MTWISDQENKQQKKVWPWRPASGSLLQNRQLHNILGSGCECCRVIVIQLLLLVCIPSIFKLPVGPVLVIKGIGFQTGVKGACVGCPWWKEVCERLELQPRPPLCLASGEGLKAFIETGGGGGGHRREVVASRGGRRRTKGGWTRFTVAKRNAPRVVRWACATLYNH